MFKERKKKEIEFLKTNLPKLVNYLNKKIDYSSLSKKEIQKIENKYITKYLDYKASRKELNKINKLKLLKKKKYKDSFYFTITELGESNKNFYNSTNIYEWSMKNWNFQKSEMIKSINDLVEYKKREKKESLIDINEYKVNEIDKINKRYGLEYNDLYLYSTWCRWIEDNTLKYGSIESIESWVLDKVSDYISKFIDNKIPNCYVHPINEMFTRSEENNKYFNLNTELRANGLEKEYELFQKKSYKITEELSKNIFNKMKKKYSKITFKDENTDSENECFVNLYIFDLETSKLISTKNFLNDFIKYQQPFSLIEKELEKILNKINIEKKLNKVYKEVKKEIKNEI